MTPAVKSEFEISLARHRPNADDMTSIARGNELNTKQAQMKSFSPDVRVRFPEPAIEYASAALSEMSRMNRPPTAALERFYAKRMGAKTSEIDASHVAFISHPKVVARLIEKAATASAKSSQ